MKHMKLKVMDFMTAEGTVEQCSEFAMRLLFYLKSADDRRKEEDAKKEARAIARAMDMTFEELMKQEQEREKEG